MRVRTLRGRFNENNAVCCIVQPCFPALSRAKRRCSGLRVSRVCGTYARDWFQSHQVRLVLSVLQASPIPDNVLFPVSSVSTISVLGSTEKLLFGFAKLLVRDDGVIPTWQNTVWFEIDKCLVLVGNVLASFILFSIQISSTV